jgi:octaprenyl-diphosphate synthase
MRPMFVFLSAGVAGNINESTHRAAALIELLHTATLVHDDVVDDSMQRRGFFSLNALWRNKIAVLVGDFLLSRGLLLAVENKEFRLLELVSRAVKEMSEGELLQIEKARRLDIEESVYYDVIRQKTASLIAACCATGASSAGADEDRVCRMHKFGELAGMAFQIKDDLFDYGSADGIGKPTGADIKERKFTLPLIYALAHADRKKSREIMNIIHNYREKHDELEKIISFVNETGGIKYAEEKMLAFKNEALSVLDTFPDKPEKKSLQLLVEYTTTRKK